MHGSYRRAFGPENVVELQKNINVQHEDYLKQDDADKKADALRYMAGYVVQYLHLVPQEKKFTFKETDRVLHNSAMNIAEFDPREGSIAFCNLAKYAENLVEQPWRKDFHVIKLTSGFYVHNIAAQLQNAHEILIVMGYVNIDDTTLKLIPNQNQNNLKAVSRDCYVASQECLILSQIWQHVADQEPDYPLTIGEVFEYRKNHLGDTDTICNKLLYDIRSRMHSVKQRQQLQLQHQLKNTQRFVPVERLIDFDPDSDQPDAPHHPANFIPEREVERTQEQLKNVNLYGYNEDEHIYDPVYSGEIPQVPTHTYQRKQNYSTPQKIASNLPPQNQYHYNNSRKSVPAPITSYQQPPPPQYHHNNLTNNGLMAYGNERNSVSPMIPKTVTSFFSSGNRSNVSKSNSMNSLNGGRGMASSSSSSSMSHNFVNQPLTKTKVIETDLDSEIIPNVPRDQLPSYYTSDNRGTRTRKSMPASTSIPPPVSTTLSHNQVYPDQFYPGIVKPVAVYGSTQNHSSSPSQMPYYQRGRLHSDNSEDVLNEAYASYAYASEVGQLPKGAPGRLGASQQPGYQHQATPIPNIHGSDSESLSESRNASVQREFAQVTQITNQVRSGSSTDASSQWDGSVREQAGYTARHPINRIQSRKTEPPKRPSHIDLRQNQIRHADSSPEYEGQPIRNKNGGYRELSSSSSGGSPASTGSRNYPRNEELSSLDTVYYDYLLKQGQTNEILASGDSAQRTKSNLNNGSSDQHHDKTHRRSGSSSRSSSSQQHHHHTNYREPEDNYMYDGRRVVPKTQNDTVIRKKYNPSQQESSFPNQESNYNLPEEMKPSHNKPMRKSNNHTEAVNRVADEGEDPSLATGPPSPKQPVEPWDCRFCTFRNLVEERICEVCAKSKDFFEEIEPVNNPVAHSTPKSVGSELHRVVPKLYSVPVPNNSVPEVVPSNGAFGVQEVEEEKECPQCTLLNPIRARVCDACNFRLKPAESPKNLEDVFDIR